MSEETLEVQPAIKGVTEPEEAPARRVIPFPFHVQVGTGPKDPNARVVSRSQVPVTSEMTAGEMANAVRHLCASCHHFRNDLWLATRKGWAGAPSTSERYQGLGKMIRQLARDCTDGEPSPRDHAAASAVLGTFGVCGALSEMKKDLVLVHPKASCPDGLNFFQDRSRPAQIAAGKAFDAIMSMALGRKP